MRIASYLRDWLVVNDFHLRSWFEAECVRGRMCERSKKRYFWKIRFGKIRPGSALSAEGGAVHRGNRAEHGCVSACAPAARELRKSQGQLRDLGAARQTRPLYRGRS